MGETLFLQVSNVSIVETSRSLALLRIQNDNVEIEHELFGTSRTLASLDVWLVVADTKMLSKIDNQLIGKNTSTGSEVAEGRLA